MRVSVGGRAGSGVALEIASRLPAGSVDSGGVPGSGTGLVGLAERVDLAWGRLRHGERDGEFLVHARLPWPT